MHQGYKMIPSKLRKSEKSGLWVATVFMPPPAGGSISLAHYTQNEAVRWINEQEDKYWN